MSSISLCGCPVGTCRKSELGLGYHCKHPLLDSFQKLAAKAVQQTDTAGAGLKYDAGKPPLGLIPRSALLAEAEVLAHGAEKYAPHNWRKGMRWSRLGDAALRHLLAWIDGEDIDPESGLPHLAHLRCCAGFLLDYGQTGAGTDDRHKPTA